MVGEENSGDGVARFTRSCQDFSWAIIGEPTSLGIARTQSGYVELEIEASSLPCHGFDPISEQSLGALSALVRDCRELVGKLSGNFRHSLFIRSFTGLGDDSFWYTRPCARARLLINSFPDSTQQMVVERVKRSAKRIERIYHGTRLRVTVADADNGLVTSKHSESVRALCSGLRSIGQEPTFLHLPSWTDGSTLTEMGIETVIFGPGNLKDAHTNAEFVRIREVEKAALVLALSCMNGRSTKPV
jgi:acetylornithine deacetylase/succinyl-diaminopimelate desuccinylase-like protein